MCLLMCFQFLGLQLVVYFGTNGLCKASEKFESSETLLIPNKMNESDRRLIAEKIPSLRLYTKAKEETLRKSYSLFL